MDATELKLRPLTPEEMAVHNAVAEVAPQMLAANLAHNGVPYTPEDVARLAFRCFAASLNGLVYARGLDVIHDMSLELAHVRNEIMAQKAFHDEGNAKMNAPTTGRAQ